MKWYDCSPPITESLPVWPGDVPYSAAWDCLLEKGDAANLSSIATTLHLGSHVDAPYHVSADAAKIDELPFELFVGRARIVEVPPSARTDERRISPAVITEEVADDCPPRVLLKTCTYRPTPPFQKDFVALSPELIDRLAGLEVKLVGLDAPSVDPFGDGELRSHHRLVHHGMIGLEGLVLKHVPPGDYELIAVPLRLAGRDGSPVRAILRTLK
ncbi:cyclase family protein [bacterium]|nr:cyclase family protein [bacterium]